MNPTPDEARSRLARGGLYLLTPPAMDAARVDRCLLPVLAAGPGILQLRLAAHTDDTPALALHLRALTRTTETLLIINDDPALAAACAADGVHLGRDDVSIAEARARLGPAAIIGASCYGDLARATACRAAGADYLAFGSIFASSTKPLATVIGTSILAEARGRFDVPLVAIGGITEAGAAACRAAGADWVAVVDAVWGQADPAAAARALEAAVAVRPEQRRPIPEA